MAKPTKRRIDAEGTSSGRTTPKGTRPGAGAGSTSGRYTPPTVDPTLLPSPPWVAILMFGFFAVGLVVIFLNYTEVLPESPSVGFLVAGILLVLGGVVGAVMKQLPLLAAGGGLGVATIVTDRLGWLPAAPSGWYLIVGLLAILGGIITATQLR